MVQTTTSVNPIFFFILFASIDGIISINLVPKEKALQNPEFNNDLDRATPYQVCGKPIINLENVTATPSSRIINGKRVKNCEIPWQVILLVTVRSTTFPCSATLIGNKYALTVAHCVQNNKSIVHPDNVTLVVGLTNLWNPTEYTKPYSVYKIKIYDSYDGLSLKNDIALIEVNNTIEFNICAQPVCLPENGSDLYINRTAKVSGWGVTDAKFLNETDNLMKTLVEIISNSHPYCLASFNTSEVMDSNMCAYREGTGTCYGDCGGPLTLPVNQKYTIVGITADPAGCALKGFAGIYTRVSSYLPWIFNNTKNDEFIQEFYKTNWQL